eukprot:TRINITY_DN41607_c0_g1_i1.p1 TRINITY_DN41607_c0_g1~~TRINITY_DN41607_c0_g1_i1.p1  ORF type:complete len:602 (+),score=131.62 TRINITY_DN41607_c0_g1_i1:62-1867(+)
MEYGTGGAGHWSLMSAQEYSAGEAVAPAESSSWSSSEDDSSEIDDTDFGEAAENGARAASTDASAHAAASAPFDPYLAIDLAGRGASGAAASSQAQGLRLPEEELRRLRANPQGLREKLQQKRQQAAAPQKKPGGNIQQAAEPPHLGSALSCREPAAVERKQAAVDEKVPRDKATSTQMAGRRIVRARRTLPPGQVATFAGFAASVKEVPKAPPAKAPAAEAASAATMQAAAAASGAASTQEVPKAPTAQRPALADSMGTVQVGGASSSSAAPPDATAPATKPKSSPAVRPAALAASGFLPDPSTLGKDDAIVSFAPGRLGLRASKRSGRVFIVYGGQAVAQGVQVGWRFKMVNDHPYTQQLLDDQRKGDAKYYVTFDTTEVVSEQNRSRPMLGKSKQMARPPSTMDLTAVASDSSSSDDDVAIQHITTPGHQRSHSSGPPAGQYLAGEAYVASSSRSGSRPPRRRSSHHAAPAEEPHRKRRRRRRTSVPSQGGDGGGGDGSLLLSVWRNDAAAVRNPHKGIPAYTRDPYSRAAYSRDPYSRAAWQQVPDRWQAGRLGAVPTYPSYVSRPPVAEVPRQQTVDMRPCAQAPDFSRGPILAKG